MNNSCFARVILNLARCSSGVFKGINSPSKHQVRGSNPFRVANSNSLKSQPKTYRWRSKNTSGRCADLCGAQGILGPHIRVKSVHDSWSLKTLLFYQSTSLIRELAYGLDGASGGH